MTNTDHRLAQLGFWLIWAGGAFLLSGILFFLGARETVLKISPLGWCLIVAAAISGGGLVAVGMLRASYSRTLDGALVRLRQLHTGAWLFRMAAMTAIVAGLVALFSWMWIHVAIRSLAASLSEVGGEVVDFSRTSAVNRFCRFHVHVRFDDDGVGAICAERGIIYRKVPASLLALKKHDRVVVTLRSNVLGTSAAITDSTPQ